VLDAKTRPAREVHLSPELADVLIRYRDARPPRCRRPRGEDPLWPSHGGRPRSRTWALGKVHRAAAVASAARGRRDLPPLPNVTPHTLRHTSISILLLVTTTCST
jgi:integrase